MNGGFARTRYCNSSVASGDSSLYQREPLTTENEV